MINASLSHHLMKTHLKVSHEVDINIEKFFFCNFPTLHPLRQGAYCVKSCRCFLASLREVAEGRWRLSVFVGEWQDVFIGILVSIVNPGGRKKINRQKGEVRVLIPFIFSLPFTLDSTFTEKHREKKQPVSYYVKNVSAENFLPSLVRLSH